MVPRRGTADLGPLVLKASAGVAFRAPLLRCETAAGAVEHLAAARFALVGLDPRLGAASLFDAALPERAAYVVGNEATGVSAPVAAQIDTWLRIPLSGGVESLNVATAATLVAFEVARRATDTRVEFDPGAAPPDPIAVRLPGGRAAGGSTRQVEAGH